MYQRYSLYEAGYIMNENGEKVAVLSTNKEVAKSVNNTTTKN